MACKSRLLGSNPGVSHLVLSKVRNRIFFSLDKYLLNSCNFLGLLIKVEILADQKYESLSQGVYTLEQQTLKLQK